MDILIDIDDTDRYGLPGGPGVKNLLQCRRDMGSMPLPRKIPWRWEQLPTPVSFLENSMGSMSPDYSLCVAVSQKPLSDQAQHRNMM